MAVDTSSIVAILRREPGFEAYLRAVTEAGEAYISAVNLLECHLVLAKTPELVARLIEDAGILVKDFTQATASRARLAFLQYGKSRQPAALNICDCDCDCAAYATAKESNLPLLYKGERFQVHRYPVSFAIGQGPYWGHYSKRQKSYAKDFP